LNKLSDTAAEQHIFQSLKAFPIDLQKIYPKSFCSRDRLKYGLIRTSEGKKLIVMGEKVRIGKVAVSYRTARVTVGAAYSGVGSSSASAPPDAFVIGDTTTVDDFVSALKAVGLKADVIIGVLQAIEKAGALFGNLVIM
jgi:hypothetical protein